MPFMKPLACLGLALALTSCGPDTTALDPIDAGLGGAGGEGGSGSGGAGRAHPDGSIEVTGGSGGSATGGSGGSTGGTGGSATGGTGGSATGGTGGNRPDAGPDAARPDAQPMTDAASMCDACAAFAAEYAEAIRKEQICDPASASPINQCGKQTPGSLTCGCPVWVTTTVLSDDVRQRFIAAGCQKCVRFTACPAIACVNPGVSGVCVASAASPGAPIAIPPTTPKGRCTAKY